MGFALHVTHILSVDITLNHGFNFTDIKILIPMGNYLFKFLADGEIHSAAMASMDPIDITSSDSESEIETKTSAPIRSIPPTYRHLPSWASTSTLNSKSYGGLSQNLLLPNRASASTERLADHNHHSQVKPQLHPSYVDKEKTLNQHTALTDDAKHSTSNWLMGQPGNGLGTKNLDGMIDFQYANMPGTDSSKVSYQQPSRTLPPSFHSTASTSKLKASFENGSSSQIPITHGKSYHSVGANITDHQVYGKDHLGRQDNDDVVMYEPSGSRVLPSSLMHGKAHTNSQSAISSESAHRSGVEERPAENDERLIFQAALQHLSQPKVEATLPDGLLAVPLLRHQKIGLAWMFQKETNSLHCLGGILADDQGLGKTVSMIALIQMQKHLHSKSTPEDVQAIKTEALNLDDDDDDGVSELEKVKKIPESDDLKKVPEVSTAVPSFHSGRPAAGTLVVCPASILRQWARELDDKVTESAKLSVLIYHGSNRTKDPVELAKYDVVLTTYSIVTNEVPKQPLVDDDDEDTKNGEKYGLSSEFSVNKKRKKMANAGKKGKKGRNGINGSSFDCNSGTLARVGWFRVILDEAQTIKNHRTQVARACCGLRAKRRWCLSGTPIQNSVDDLFSYFRFLKYDPYAVYKSFVSSIKYPISRNSGNGYKKLQAVLKAIMLRRTKGTLIDGEPIINLPPKTINLTKVEFSSEERAFYSKLESDSRSQFKAYAAAGTVNQNYANILLMLLRLRQACDHPFLVKGYHSDSVGAASLEMARKLPKDTLVNLLNSLEASLPLCGVCNDSPEDGVVTICRHVFCYQCVSEYLTGDDNLCPASGCKEQLSADVVFSKSTLISCISDELNGTATSVSEVAENSLALPCMYGSSKIRAAIEFLEKHCKLTSSSTALISEGCNGSGTSHSSEANNDVNTTATHLMENNMDSQTKGPEKAIVFSQWTSMLDLVETALNHSLIQYRRLDGTMTLSARDKAVKDFNSDPEVTVMLMSLKAGNLGLNMVAACHVILLDLWWNPTTEDQAVDRAHRIGQTRPVTVTRLTVKDTVEDRILALQEEKRKMVASAFGEDHMGGPATRLTVEDLRYLFMV
ncbi:SNF2-related [Macleaya cordata]|uniref:SNF2-related n=2 Tax=Papaveroideae TaxID=1462614 RepID=A0A200QAD0_MACCD|nr:SNF2-related [Macleaya cordata]